MPRSSDDDDALMAEFDPPPPELQLVEEEVLSRSSSSTLSEAREPSKVFGAGGKFLSKYDSVSVAGPGHESARARNKGDLRNISMGSTSPEGVNAQLTALIVNAKSRDQVLQVADVYFDYLTAVNLIIVLHRLAMVVLAPKKVALHRNVRVKSIVGRLTDALRTSTPGFLKPHDLSNAVWAVGKLGLRYSLCGQLSRHVMCTLSSFDPSNLSTTTWALARAGTLDEKLFRAVATEMDQRLADFAPQHVARIAWAAAKSKFIDKDFFQMVAQYALDRSAEFQLMSCSMLLNAFALAKVHHRELFDAMATHCTKEAVSAPPQAHMLTNLARALTSAGVDDEQVFLAVGDVASSNLDDFRSQHIAGLAQSFSRAGVKHEKLFEAISKAVENRLGDFKRQDLEDVLAAFELLAIPTTDIARAVGAQHWQEQPSKRPGGRFLLVAIGVLSMSVVVHVTCAFLVALHRAGAVGRAESIA